MGNFFIKGFDFMPKQKKIKKNVNLNLLWSQ